jgi:hydrogenase expression/formation protein HypD
VLVDSPPSNFSVLSAHKYIPPVMEIVAEMPETRIEGFLAAGHAATITGWGVFEAFVERHQIPVVVAGFEPLDVLAGLCELVQLIRAGTPAVRNAYPRCVTREGNVRAQELLWRVFRPIGGRWRGIAHVQRESPLRHEFAIRRAAASTSTCLRSGVRAAQTGRTCQCGDIVTSIASPAAVAVWKGARTRQSALAW